MSITVTLDRPIFAPGEAVTGTVEVCTDARLKLKGVHVKLHGDRSSPMGSHQRVVDLQQLCFGTLERDSFLEAGTYRYPLCLQLPADAPPSSYHAANGVAGTFDYVAVEYKLTAVIERRHSHDIACRGTVLVADPLPAVAGPPAASPSTAAFTRLRPWEAAPSDDDSFLGLVTSRRQRTQVSTTVWVANTAVALPIARREKKPEAAASAAAGRQRLSDSAQHGVIVLGLFPATLALEAAMLRVPPPAPPAPGDPPQLRLRVAVKNRTKRMTLRCLQVELLNVVSVGGTKGETVVLEEQVPLSGAPRVSEWAGGGGELANGVPPGAFAMIDLRLPAPPAVLIRRSSARHRYQTAMRLAVDGTLPAGSSMPSPTLSCRTPCVRSHYRLRLSFPGKHLSDFTADTAIRFVVDWSTVGGGKSFSSSGRRHGSHGAATGNTGSAPLDTPASNVFYGVPIYPHSATAVAPATAAAPSSSAEAETHAYSALIGSVHADPTVSSSDDEEW